MLFWIWISSGILVLCLVCVGWFRMTISFFVGRGRQALRQAQDVFSGTAFVANFIHVPADELNAPAARRIVVVRLRFAGSGDRGIKLRPAVAQLDQKIVLRALHREVKSLMQVALQRVVDDV